MGEAHFLDSEDAISHGKEWIWWTWTKAGYNRNKQKQKQAKTVNILVPVYPRRLRAYRKMTSPDCLKIRRKCIKTLDFSISFYIILLHSIINGFTCSWQVSNTYHSPVNILATATYYIRITPMYWSKLRRNCYETDKHLPSSYSRSENLFCTRSVATGQVTSLKIKAIRCTIMLCHFGQTRNR